MLTPRQVFVLASVALLCLACGGGRETGEVGAGPTYRADVVLARQQGVHIASATLCEDVDAGGAPLRPATSFAPGAQPRLVVELTGAPVGTLVEALWYRGTTLLTGQNANTDEIKGSRVSFHLVPEAPLAPDAYRVVVRAEGESREVPFVVGGNP